VSATQILTRRGIEPLPVSVLEPPEIEFNLFGKGQYDVWSSHPTSKGGVVAEYFSAFAPVVVPDYSGINLTLLNMQQEIADIKGELASQRVLMEHILSRIGNSGVEIQIEEVDDTVAREQILKLFKEHSGSLFYDEIAEKLNLPLRQTVEICNQLEQEGLIGEPTTKR
jgi:hypothetical protein